MTQAVLRPWTVGAIVFVVTVCMSPVALVQPVTAAVGQGALLWLVVALSVGWLGVELNVALVESPLAPWAQHWRRRLGYLRAPFYLAGAAAMLSVWLNILSATELPQTPRWVASLLTLGAVVYALRLGFEPTARLLGLIGLLVAPGLLLLLIAVLPEMQPGRLLPNLFGDGVVPWTWPMILFMPRGYDVLPVFGPQVQGPYRAAVRTGVGAGGLYLLLSMTAPALIFGFPATAQMGYPFLKAIGIVSSPYIPFQRVAFVSFILWQMIGFAVVAAYSICGMHSLGVRMQPLTPWPVLTAWTGTVFLLTLEALPSDAMVSIKTVWSLYGLLLFIALPSALLAAGWRRTARAA